MQEIEKLEDLLSLLYFWCDLHENMCKEIEATGTKHIRKEEYEHSYERIEHLNNIEIPRLKAEIEKRSKR